MYEKPFNPFSKNLAIVKEYFRSPAVLVMGIVRILGAALAVAAAAIAAVSVSGIVGDIQTLIANFCEMTKLPAPSMSDISYALDGVQASASYFSVPAAIPAAVVSLLIALAFFIIFFKSRSSKPEASPAGGIAVLYVFAVIELIIGIIAAVAVVLLFVFLFWIYFQLKSSATGNFVFSDITFFGDQLKIEVEPDLYLAMIIAYLIAAVVIMFIVLLFIVSKKRYYGSVRASLSSVELRRDGAKPYGVMCVLRAIVSALCLLPVPAVFAFGKGMLTSLPAVTIVYGASCVISFITNVLDAKIALGYKKYIDDKKYGYNRHAASSAPYSPLPAGGGFAPQNRPQNNPYVNSAFSAGASLKQSDEPSDSASSGNPYSDAFGADDISAGAASAAADKKAPLFDESDGTSPFADLFDEGPDTEDDVSAEPEISVYPDSGEPDDNEPEISNVSGDADAGEPAQDAPAICHACGAEVDPGSAFCGNCGTKL